MVFGFHNVTPAGSPPMGDRSLHLNLQTFTSVVDWIGRAFVVLPLAELVARAEAGRSLRKLAAITFDDAYQGVFTHGLPVLERAGLPATVFVVSTAGASPAFFWWDVLSERGMLTDQTRDLCLGVYRGDRAWIQNAFPTGREPRLPPDCLPAPWSVIQGAMGGVVTIGSHTRTHRNLVVLRRPELTRELELSRTEIGAQLGSPPDLVSYPYGRLDSTVLREAGQAGYRGGVTTQYGTVSARSSPLALPRVSVPSGIRLETLECWAAGMRLRRSA